MTGLLAPASGRVSLAGAVNAILDAQSADGAIAWFRDGPWDAWNHAECVMALGVAGEHDAAAAGFEHLARCQAPCGGWLSGYGNALPMTDDGLAIARVPAPVVRDTNFTAYPATALWHHWRLHGDRRFIDRYWPTVRDGIDHVLLYQHEQGDVSWCAEAWGDPADDAVLAGNASIWGSLGHACALAELMGDERPGWVMARARLGAAIIAGERFDRARADRSGFAMDWYYPVLTGVLGHAPSRARLGFGRHRFIEEGRGCRCVASEPWATVAESAELALALIGLGLRATAATLLGWQEAHRDGDGAYWMGWQYDQGIAWPREKPSWTQAAMILAHDALADRTPAARVIAGR